MRSTRSRFAVAAMAAVFALVGCASDGDDPDAPVTTDQPTDAATEPSPSEPEPTATDDGTVEPEPSPTETEQAAPPLEGTPGTDPAQAEPDRGGTLAVTEVRVGSHDGFDRVVFEVAGDEGRIGWDVRYVDVPTSQGSGDEADVDGTAFLAVSISGVALPPDLPPGVEAFTSDVDGPDGGSVVEVVHDSIFEGYHLFFVGLDAELPYVVERLEDPQRLVVDLHRG